MNSSEEPIIVEQIFNTPIEYVWSAITNLERMKKWFFPNITDFEPIIGFESRFVIQNEDRVFPHIWKLTEVIPLKKISYEWRFEGYSGSGISTFELIEDGSLTRLRLTYTVLEQFPDNIPEFKRESGLAGWTYFIKESLKNYLEER